MNAIEVRRPMKGAFALKSFPFRVIRGTLLERLADGRVLVEYSDRSGRRHVERCALSSVYAIDGFVTPWHATLEPTSERARIQERIERVGTGVA